MKIRELTISNFKAITKVELLNLENTIVIAGPNGCGKSCLFDAIRLLKSIYGGYSNNEWHQWFGEFQIDPRNRFSWIKLLQDPNKELLISATFEFHCNELSYLKNTAETILSDIAWQEEVPSLRGRYEINNSSLASEHRNHRPAVEQKVRQELPRLLNDLEQNSFEAKIFVDTAGKPTITSSRVLEIVFSRYDSENIGIIDYHGAARNYSREQIGGINLNIESTTDRLRQNALYNYTNKYTNLKTEMASSYIRSLLAEEAGIKGTSNNQDLNCTLKELFQTFFPGKEFLGPQPTEDGALLFQVKTANGNTHDIDDLSSGEKEVLYGYLRLRNAAPKHSVLLLDEPELHLNPRLVSGLATFYHTHLGQALDTQLWLVTHSDTLIREAVGQAGFSVYHMQPAGNDQFDNQVTLIKINKDIDKLIIDLIGDLAAYRPEAKIVIFEGSNESEFDVSMTCDLFPEFSAATNPISGGNKHRVEQLYGLLQRLTDLNHVPGKFYAITDLDDGSIDQETGSPRRFRWDVYHIENYLLVSSIIFEVLNDLSISNKKISSESDIQNELKSCAASTIKSLVNHKLQNHVNQTLINSIKLKCNPASENLANEYSNKITDYKIKVETAIKGNLSINELSKMEKTLMQSYENALEDGSWIKKFRGRDVLKSFVNKHVNVVSYEIFRNLIISKMRNTGYQPAGMKSVINNILND